MWKTVGLWLLLPAVLGVGILFVFEWPHGAIVHTRPTEPAAPVIDAGIADAAADAAK